MGVEPPFSGSSAREPTEVIDESVTVIIVNYRTPELTEKCLSHLRDERSAFRNLHVIVVDGGSADGSADKLATVVAGAEFQGWVELLALSINGGFGWANNQAMQRLISGSEPPQYIHLLNPDAEIEPRAVSLLADYLNRNPRVAAVGSQLVEPDGSLSGSAFIFPSIRGEFARGAQTGILERLLRVPPISIDATQSTEVDWVTGASVMFRVAALQKVGLFDEGIFLYHDEVELMWRMRRAGWAVAIEPRSRVRHIGGAATGVHDRETEGSVRPRVPAYFYRSRARFFGLTRGRWVATFAFLAWVAGHAVWSARRILGLAPRSKPIDHQLRDHLSNAFPRHHDFVAAAPKPDAPPTKAPRWISDRWL